MKRAAAIENRLEIFIMRRRTDTSVMHVIDARIEFGSSIEDNDYKTFTYKRAWQSLCHLFGWTLRKSTDD